ncbi:McKusick-Kaufman/Bardet-Biedl syndromes putative chaperonin isoform X2 [Nematostella vectensis]|uniref:McKusick-Kaufman/Bardet-Biedl syndromes putative chaperonin isoform X2 n=1 Tax=Nematostella vectensis TaxID=45351 RepID=UPI0013903269|nr:McKusick-Kaufman/Bardet-Biedl syndromes putative chaperonin isoform X2 [Nematostella vectensis]
MSRRELISVEKTTRKQIYSKPLDSPTVLDALAVFGKLCKSSYGPTGRLKFLQTALGGHVTVTSSCATILHHLISSCHPIVHLVMLAVKGHLDVYGDGGLATCILTTRLIETSIKLAIPRQLVVEVYAYALGIMTSYMVSEKHPWKMKLDVSDMKSMMCLLRSVLHTKPASCLTERDLNHMCTTLLKAFLHSLPSMSDAISHPLSPSPVQFLRCEGSAVIDSRVVDGVLLQAPSVLQPHHQLIQQPVKVALYNISMATDTEEWFSDVTTTTVDVSDSGLNTGILKQMIDVAMVLVSAGVGLVACQKCIHPTLKRFLKDRKVYVFDRLSVMHINAVQRLTGATLLSTFTTDIPEHWYGQLDSIEYTVIANKSYLHLIPTQPMTSVCTVILCSPDESSLEELLSTCQSAMSVLAQVVAYPWVVPGAGCMDTHLAGFLRTKALREKEEAAKNLGCTRVPGHHNKYRQVFGIPSLSPGT